jgi:cellulose synthase/poly-beta-1,6-N-acetylglucosamine synthase-like glycosyltransferase
MTPQDKKLDEVSETDVPPPSRRDGAARRGELAPWPAAGRVSALCVVLGLGLFLFVKFFFRQDHSNGLLWAYGVAVTFVVAVQMYIGLFRYRDPVAVARQRLDEAPGESTDAHPLARPPLVTCLVAVHNEEHVLEQCIRSMTSQTYQHLEIIVVDDASTDRTPQLLDELASRYPIRVIKLQSNVGKKRALAAGLLCSTGGILAFTDSDSCWNPDAIEKAVAVFQTHPHVGAVSGHCRALNAEHGLLTKMQDSWYEGQFSVRKAFESVFGAVTCVSGPLAVFRREAIYNYIPAWEQDSFLGDEFRFATDRTLTGYVLMDERSSRKLRTRNVGTEFALPEYAHASWEIVYSKSIRSLTVVPDNLASMLRQQVRWKKSFIRNIFFTGRFYWRRPLVPAVAYYLHVFFVFAGPLVAFRHLVYLPLHGNLESMVLYVFGIVLVGTFFGLAFWREDPESRTGWYYRPLMSLFSTLVISWLVAYSAVTIKKMSWTRG